MEYEEISEDENYKYDFTEVFIDECIYDFIDFITDVKEELPYFFKTKTKKIVDNLHGYLLYKNFNGELMKYNYSDDLNFLLFFLKNINNIIDDNKRLYKITDSYRLTVDDIIKILN